MKIKKPSPKSVVKFAVATVVTTGTGFILHAIVKNNIQPEKLIPKICVIAGTVVVTAMVSDAAEKYVNTAIDDITTIHESITSDSN